jgi:hypothetical protein
VTPRAEIPYGVSQEDEPWRRYNIQDDDVYVMDWAYYLVQADCLAEHGFESSETLPKDAQVVIPLDTNGINPDLGLLSMKGASTWGYQWTNLKAIEVFEEEGAFDAFKDPPVNYDPEYQDARTKPGGCNERATAASNGSSGIVWTEADSAALGGVVDRAKPRAEQDERVVGALEAWSECMKSEGYDYEHPLEPTKEIWPLPVRDQDLAVAVRDVECKHETQLVETWREVLYAFEEEEIAKSRPILEKSLKWIEGGYKNSMKVIAEHGMACQALGGGGMKCGEN